MVLYRPVVYLIKGENMSLTKRPVTNEQLLHSRLDFLTLFRSLLGDVPGVVVIHSDISKFKMSGPGFIWDVLFAIKCMVDEGWSFYFPSFTFSFCGGQPYSFKDSPSETGILADKVIENFVDAQRTLDPIYSFVTIGRKNNSVYEKQAETTFGLNSIFEFFEKANAKVMMLGCTWEYCTLFHRYEELADVQYREFKVFEGKADFGSGFAVAKSKMFVRKLDLDPLNDFSPAVKKLNETRMITKAMFCDASIQIANAADIKEVCTSQLDNDALTYVANKNLVQKRVRDSKEKIQQEDVTISIFGHKNNDIIERHLIKHLSEKVPERSFDIIKVPYGQMYNHIISAEDTTDQSLPKFKFFLDRLTDIRGVDICDCEKTKTAITEYAKLIELYHKKSRGWTFVNLFFKGTRSSIASDAIKVDRLVSECNRILEEMLGSISQIVLVDVSSEIALYDGPVFDPRLYFVGRFPFSDGFSSHLALSWASLIISAIGKDVRLIVVDLDNTLWGGVLGEDGIENLHIGGDFPGNAFLDFQNSILEYQKRGVALAIASKNDEDLALQALSSIPEMVIRDDHVQAYGINWEPKWKNIKRICDDLNLGLSSVLFIDDNPVEREAVRRNLPDVKILPISDDVTEYSQILNTYPFLRALRVTNEDMSRLKDYDARKQRKSIQSHAVSLEDYYSSLQMVLALSPVNSGNLARAVQLCQKTNQFNTTTRRYDEKEILAFVEQGHEVFVVNYQDQFSAPENIGVMIIKYGTAEDAAIDLFLLSCRVLGRGFEAALPNILAKYLHEKNVKKLFGEIIITERNTPAQSVYEKANFQKVADKNLWMLETKNYQIAKWVEYEFTQEGEI